MQVDVPEVVQMAGLEETENPRSMAHEQDGIESNIHELESEGPELQARMTAAVYAVLMMQILLQGGFLQAVLTAVHHGVENTDTAIVIFARPLGALSRLPMQLLVLVMGLYFMPQTFRGFTPHFVETRHVRLTTLEMRDPKKVVCVNISKLSLLLGRSPNDPLNVIPHLHYIVS